MKFLNTDLNSPWSVTDWKDGDVIPSSVKKFANQYKFVSDEIAVRLNRAWAALYDVDAEADEFPSVTN